LEALFQIERRDKATSKMAKKKWPGQGPAKEDLS